MAINIDLVFEDIGELGPQQLKYCLILAFFNVYGAWHMLQYTFVGYDMPFECHLSNGEVHASTCPGTDSSRCSRVSLRIWTYLFTLFLRLGRFSWPGTRVNDCLWLEFDLWSVIQGTKHHVPVHGRGHDGCLYHGFDIGSCWKKKDSLLLQCFNGDSQHSLCLDRCSTHRTVFIVCDDNQRFLLLPNKATSPFIHCSSAWMASFVADIFCARLYYAMN